MLAEAQLWSLVWELAKLFWLLLFIPSAKVSPFGIVLIWFAFHATEYRIRTNISALPYLEALWSWLVNPQGHGDPVLPSEQKAPLILHETDTNFIEDAFKKKVHLNIDVVLLILILFYSTYLKRETFEMACHSSWWLIWADLLLNCMGHWLFVLVLSKF